ncbi:leucine--tRNA ligase, partial [Patescibacteria group bacterium]|nr:leucine--tRNA ligase [Patescibacteria group bacterium]
MINNYDHKKIEEKWRKIWEETELYKTSESRDKEKCYILDMFPYPSGAGLHVGHPKGYIATDVVARMKMLQGYNVLHPMGWDAFGLPTENYAIKNKIHPSIATEKNIAIFKAQLEKLGFTYDWSREINTTDPEFYKWTQWVFLQMFKKGLAYESYEPIIWCPSCQTGLAMEDLENGKCERCGSEVERKPMRQWVLKITDYAERLLNDLEKLPQWEESIKEMQRNWIGKSEGAIVKFSIFNFQFSNNNQFSISNNKIDCLEVFTTRPDTLFGCTYMVVAPEHPLIRNQESEIKNQEEIDNYVNQAKKKSDLERTDLAKEKTGVELKGIKAINPVNKEEIPIFVADYVLAGYGTGAIMAVPAHDERDYDFAVKYDLPIKQVVVSCHSEESRTVRDDEESQAKSDKQEYTNKNIKEQLTRDPSPAAQDDNNSVFSAEGININSNLLDGLPTKEAKEKIIKWLEEKGAGKRAVNYKLKDWVFSRQRYWGEPIPLIFCNCCKKLAENYKLQITNYKQIQNSKLEIDSKFKIQNYEFNLGEILNPGWVADENLPLELPAVEHYEPSGTGESPLANMPEWVNVKCPKCGGPAKRETNTMPQWAGSSWYYLRYIDPRNGKALVDKEKEKYWSPVDLYVGGAEHATRHLIYARFWHKFLYDIGVVNYDEPFTRLRHVGVILAEDGRKMSKRWGNVINPDEVVEKYGADATRVYEMFMGPFSQPCAWSANGLKGARNFLEKVWALKQRITADFATDSRGIDSLLHKTVKKVGEDIEEFKFNTAISAMMIFINNLEKENKMSLILYSKFLILLSPFAPFMSEELWR